MKKTYLLSIMMLVSILCSFSINAQSLTNEAKVIIGNWIYSAPEAPYGYESGKMNIKAEGGKLTGELIIQNYPTKINEIKYADATHKCTVVVDGMAIGVSMKKKDSDTFEGVATVDGWDIPLTLKRVKE